MKKVIIVFLFAFLFTSRIYSQQEQWTRELGLGDLGMGGINYIEDFTTINEF